MFIKKKKITKPLLIILYSFLTFFYTPLLTYASKAYITDQFRISLRRGPTIENKILRFLPSGSPVEILTTTDEGWAQVKTLSPDEKQITGWVLSRYLIHRLPFQNQSVFLKEENEKLKKELIEIKNRYNLGLKKIDTLSKELKEVNKELKISKTNYTQLKKNSKNYFSLKDEFNTLKKELKEAIKTKKTIESKRRHQWMAVGASILVFGYLLGFIGGKKEKKTKRRGFL